MIVEIKLDYDQSAGGLRRILGVEFPAGKVVSVAPKVAGFVVAKYGDGAKGGKVVKVAVVSGKPEPWVKPERPDPRAWDETLRLPQVDPERPRAKK